MTNENSKITLIVAGKKDMKDVPAQDRMGGTTHGMKEDILKKASEIEIDADVLKKNLEKTIKKVAETLIDVGDSISDNWKLDGISVGLSISAEGSIGIATAGVETSIEVSFSPK